MRLQLNRLIVVVGLVLTLPAIALAEKVRRGAGRRVAGRAIRTIAALLGVRFEIRTGVSRPEGPVVLVPIHRSPIDIAAVFLSQPDARFMAAAELFRIPLLGATMRALDCVPIDRSDRRGALAQIRQLATSDDKRPLVVFAEGGIREGGLGKLHSGAFVIAATRAIPVVPVAIWGAADVLPPNAGFKVRPGLIVIELASPIQAQPGYDHRTLRQQTSEALTSLLASGPRAA